MRCECTAVPVELFGFAAFCGFLTHPTEKTHNTPTPGREEQTHTEDAEPTAEQVVLQGVW